MYLLDKHCHETFGFTVGVDVCSIDRINPKIPCGFHDRERRLFVQDPRLSGGDHMRLRSHGVSKRGIRTLHFGEPKLMAPNCADDTFSQG